MRSQEKLFVIEQIPLFADISIKDRKFIAASSAIMEVKCGDVIYNEGAPPDALYCVIAGRLRVYIRKANNETEDLEYLTRGKYFGIISLLTGEPHSATVQAINDSTILKIPKDEFDKILKRLPRLAIHFGQTLSRRLKRKDLHEKRVFESTIIAVFGTADKIGATNYIFNLGLSLKVQTNKKIILLRIDKEGLILKSPFFNEGIVKNNISKGPLDIDIINIRYNPNQAAYLISLLSYLTQDYHYVLVDLPTYIDKIIFELLKQSDMIYIITASDRSNLHLTGRIISDLERSLADIGHKIKVITSEYGVAKILDYANRREILQRDIFATLPDINKSTHEIGKSKISIVIEYPDCEYSRAIRRISREIGNCLTGLALGSGAALGLAHVGILKVLERENIPIDIVAGTSIGALIGALWASGRNAPAIEDIMVRFKRKIETLRLFDLVFPKRGLIKGREVKRFLHSQFGDMTFYDLKFPLKVVACDIEKREEVVLDRGKVADAVMASIAIPGIFEPVMIDSRLLVDGGIINPLPTNVLMKLSVAKIIAINALPSPEDIQKSKKKVSNIFDVIVNSIQASEYLLAEISCQNADIALHPVLPTVDWYEFYESSKVIRRGEEEALKYLPRIKDLTKAIC